VPADSGSDSRPRALRRPRPGPALVCRLCGRPAERDRPDTDSSDGRLAFGSRRVGALRRKHRRTRWLRRSAATRGIAACPAYGMAARGVDRRPAGRGRSSPVARADPDARRPPALRSSLCDRTTAGTG
jgi:hypothetical protein